MDFGKCLRRYGPFELWVRIDPVAGQTYWAIHVFDKPWRGGSKPGQTEYEALAEAQLVLAEAISNVQMNLMRELVRR